MNATNWSNGCSTDTYPYSYKPSYFGNLNENIYNNNLTRPSCNSIDNILNNKISENSYSQNISNYTDIYQQSQNQRKQWSDFDVQTKAAAAASWGIMFPMQMSSNVSPKSPWAYDLTNSENEEHALITRGSHQKKTDIYSKRGQGDIYRNVSLKNIEQTLDNLTVNDSVYSGNSDFLSPSKKTWAVVVGNSETSNTMHPHHQLHQQQQNACSMLANQTELLKSHPKINPSTHDFDVNVKTAKFFVIKSYSEDDVYRSIKYQIWCSTEAGNRRLDSAYSVASSSGIDIPIFMCFSVNGSGHFCGVAQMSGPVDYKTRAGVWAQGKWKGQFRVQWIFVKDVPNSQLRHIRLETNDNKPVTNSRDVTEIPFDKGRQVLKIIAGYKATSSIYDDFDHYEQRELSESTS